ncbi:PH domain-containing protein [Georgenia alba]|uniref:PH domain-containing protein n=1 Tax=Georgenia alba TaxID=2233858 RepID=A0ABW2Q8L3_9MICO
MRSTITVRAGSSKTMAVLCWLGCAAVLVTVALNGGAAELAAYGAVPVAAAALVWAVFWEPHVTVDRDGVCLANVWRTIRVPWSLLESVDTRWGLRLHTSGKRYSSWAVPARSRYRPGDRNSRHPEPDLLEVPDGEERIVSADSEQIGRVIETRLLGGAASGAAEDQVSTTLNTRPIAVVLGTAAVAALTVTLLG